MRTNGNDGGDDGDSDFTATIRDSITRTLTDVLKINEDGAPPELLEALEVKFRTGEAPELLTALKTAGFTPSRGLLEKISKAGRDKCLGCNQMYAPKTLCDHLNRHPEHRIGTVAKEKKLQHELKADLIKEHPPLAEVPQNLKAFRESGLLTEEEQCNIDIRLDRQSYRRKEAEMRK